MKKPGYFSRRGRTVGLLMCIYDVVRGYVLFAKTAGSKKGTGRKLPERGNSVGSNPADLGKNCLTSMAQMIDFWPTKNPDLLWLPISDILHHSLRINNLFWAVVEMLFRLYFGNRNSNMKQ